jgi:hypothetical protein
MSTYLRRDDWITDALGNAQSGASVYVCSQPATTTSIPPSPLAQLYSDPAGAFPITQPVITDGYGHAFYYLPSGTYTVIYTSPQIQEVILPDQVVVSLITATWNNDGSNIGTITGAINGSNTLFTLSAAPTPATSLLFMTNGLVQAGWLLSGSTVTLAVAPHAGSILTAIYQTT